MSYPRLGISNALPSNTKVVYARVQGRGSVGRIADLFAHAAREELKQDDLSADKVGVLIHSLLSAVFSNAKGSLYVEFGTGYEETLLACRYSIVDLLEHEPLPNGIDQWIQRQWKASPAFGNLRRLLRGADRLEARFNLKLKLIEWRVVRKLNLEVVSDAPVDVIPILDDSDRIYQTSELPQELSELPFDKWLEDVYRASGKSGIGPQSGEIYIDGESLQNETELSRVISEREKIKVEDSVKQEMNRNCWEDGVADLDMKSSIDAENEQRVEQKADEILAEIDDIKDERARAIVHETKRRELRAKHDLIVSQRKVEKYEGLLQEKEKQIQKKLGEIRVLNSKLATKSGDSELSENAQKFREKALQMAEALRRVKEDNEALERMVLELRQKIRPAEGSGGTPARLSDGGVMTVAQQQLEDMTKKLEAMTRALDSEKSKVGSLVERVTVAEKEAQAAGPIIEDLETKVEHTLKVAQQHKKETEQVKQKLVQSEAEKNKIKNELVKAQAQIQTLMKRHAS